MATASQRQFVSGHHFLPKAEKGSRFEREVARLGLDINDPTILLQSLPLRLWCQRHRDSLYVPEILLHGWGMETDPYMSGW